MNNKHCTSQAATGCHRQHRPGMWSALIMDSMNDSGQPAMEKQTGASAENP